MSEKIDSTSDGATKPLPLPQGLSPAAVSVVASEAPEAPTEAVDDSAPIRGIVGASGPKVREWEHRDGGFANSGWFCRTRTLAPGEARTAHSEDVPSDAPEHDWQRGNP